MTMRAATSNSELLIVATGHSIKNIKLNLVRMPKLGVNYAYRFDTCFDYYLFLYTLPPDLKNFIPESILFTSGKNSYGRQIGGIAQKRFSPDALNFGLSGWRNIVMKAVELGYGLGYRKIYLGGFDLQFDKVVHAYEQETPDFDIEACRREYEGALVDLDLFIKQIPKDLTIFNCSNQSRVRHFPYFEPSGLY
jgi:hypothetical protein